MYKARIEKLRKIMMGQKIDALLVSNFYNIIYLTGFRGMIPTDRDGFVVVTQKSFVFYTHTLSKVKVALDGPSIKPLSLKSPFFPQVIQLLQSENIDTLHFEAQDLKFDEYQRFSEQLKLKFEPSDQIILRQREIKDEDEMRSLKKACKITDECLREFSKEISIGRSEKELAWWIERWVREKGYDTAFDPMVAIDKNAANIHHNSKLGRDRVKSGSLILVDMGIRYESYNSDITRVFFMGNVSIKKQKIYKTLLNAQTDAIKNIRNFTKLNEVDQYCRRYLTERKLPEFMHTFHGIGLEVHEHPRFSPRFNDYLLPNQVITVEPGVYFPGKFGMRIEDTVLIGADLKPQVLTKFPKELFITGLS